MKKCIRCKKSLPEDCFNKNKRMSDGLYYYCKVCKSAYSKMEYLRHKKDYERRCYEWRKTEKGKASIKKTYQTQREKFPEKYSARNALNVAISYGKIKRPKVCSCCGKEARICAHHYDYSKPLEVIWLCYQCHTKKHSSEE